MQPHLAFSASFTLLSLIVLSFGFPILAAFSMAMGAAVATLYQFENSEFVKRFEESMKDYF